MLIFLDCHWGSEMKRLITALVASLFLTSLASGEATSGLPHQGVTHTSDAHEAYLKGESEKSKNTAESVRNAIRHFEEAQGRTSTQRDSSLLAFPTRCL